MSNTELFAQAFPYYLSIGCSYHEFFECPAWVAASYRIAYDEKFEQRNYQMWLQGLYFQDAVSSALAMALWNKKGKKPAGYMEHPIPITEHEREVDQQRRIEETLKWVRANQQ